MIKTLDLMIIGPNASARLALAAWPMCLVLVLALFIPCVEGAERFDWMPAQIDEQGLNSQDLGGEQIIPEIIITETPKPTADMSKFTKKYVLELKKFNISNTGTNPAETSKGLNQALQHAKTLGANRIVFPKGTYLISETDPVIIDHKNTIIDLNGSMLQIRPNKARGYKMVQIINGAENFRLTNGILRGDADTRSRSAAGGELLVFFSGKNLEVDHLKLVNSPGFCVASKAAGNRTRAELLAMIMDSVYIDNLEQGALSEQGKKIASTEKMRTIKPYDATKCKGEFEFGRGGIGYQGYPFIKGRVYQVYFYDKDMKFLEMSKHLQYKRVAVPKKARFMHLEFNQQEVTGKPKDQAGRITNFKPPTDVHFHDNHIVENKALGMAYCGGQKWLIENNVFEKNGPDVVGWGFDFEDGWELMQHVVLRNNLFKNNLKGDLVICAGSELLFEGNTFTGNVNVYGRPHNYTFRNNKFTGGRVGYMTRTGVAKIHNNTYANCSISIVFDTKAVADGLYRKPGETVVTPPLTLANETLVNVSKITGTYFNFKNSKLTNTHFVAGGQTRMVNLKNCQFDGVSLEYLDKGPDVHVTIKDCKGKLEQKGPGLNRKKLVTVAEATVAVKVDFAGANVIVQNNVGNTVQIAPDLRGGKPWFYWYFEATADKPGRVTFVLPAKGLAIGMQGPAVSLDLGKTWRWAGTDHVKENTFFYDFAKAGQKVRFAVTIPYLQSNLDAFLKDNEGNPHLTKSVLTKSKKGRNVELLQIGQPGAGKKAVLFTARHHACESMASFVLEGFLRTTISDTPEAVAFRKNYVLYVVPFVDKDGVEEGDQGKNRAPHDHNRDYGLNSIHPEIDAIEALGVSKNIQFLMDWHCPTLRMADHQIFYFVGPRSVPVSNMANVSAFAALIDREFPPNSPAGPFNWMRAANNPTMCTSYFGIQPKMVMSTALEVPYAPRGRNMDAASCRLYGAAILRAWTGMAFEYSPEYLLTVNNGSGDDGYIEGLVVDIAADAPPTGQVFDAWTGHTATIPNIYDPTTTVTMPAAAVTVTATYKEPGTLHTLTVNGGTGDGSYSENAVVDIVANPPAQGQEFVVWTGDTAHVADVDEPATSITMPAQDVTVTATWQTATLHMLAYWEMEETEGSGASDSTDNAYDLVPTGGLTISGATTTGKFGNGFAFNGNGGRFTHSTLLDVMGDEITIAGWVKPDATGMSAGQCWLSKQNVGGMGEQLWLKFNMSSRVPTSIGASYRSGGVFINLNSSVTWTDDTWYHYAFTWDSNGARIYVDGKPEGSNTTPIMGDGTAIDLSIGTGGLTSQPFKGVIDDVRIYEDVLTDQEIADLYNCTGPPEGP